VFPLFSAEAAPPLRSGAASAENSNNIKNKLIFKDLKDFLNLFIKMSFGANIGIFMNNYTKIKIISKRF